jgi:hypothetical protein
LSSSIVALGYEELHAENSLIGISIFYKSAKFNLIESKCCVYEEISEEINIMNASVKTSADHDRNIKDFVKIHSSREYFIYVHLKLKNHGKYSSQRDFIFVETQINTLAK